ncbi:cell division protein PerM [Jiangella endophytica]|uniref:cell division protein PerM n=1 Tax=Jiangella endophytica TaxID=1623398 RepID=UPI000E344528|nr:DUF6350 family protein [Jiangella endophytica]
MADLLTRPLLRRDEPAWGSRVPWLAAIVATAWALLAGFALCVLPGVAVWIAEGAVGPLGDPLRFASRVWLTAHRAGLEVGDGSFTLAPLGLTLLFVLLLHRSARWAAHSAGVATTRGAVAVVVPAVVTYVVGAAIIAGFSTTPGVAGDPIEAVLWAALWSAAAVTAGVAHESGLLADWWWRVPPLMRAALAGAGVAVAGLVGVGAVLMGVSLVAHTGRIGDLATALDAGPLGATLLIVGSALLVPNLVVWSAAFALGPGFAVGTATSVAPDGVTLGLVPAVPVLGALPSELPGSLTWLVVAGPVLAGLLAGLLVHRRLGPVPVPGDDEDTGVRLGSALGVTVGAAAIAGIAMAVLALLSGGSAGAERLSVLGPVPWEVAAATFGLVSVPAAVAVLVLRFRRGPADPDADLDADPDADPDDGDDVNLDEATDEPDDAGTDAEPVDAAPSAEAVADPAAAGDDPSPPPPPPTGR